MNTQIVLDKMKKMRLHGMHRAYQSGVENTDRTLLTADETVTQLIDSEWDERTNHKLERSLKNARFRYSAGIEQINFGEQRGLDKNLIHRLAECNFIKRKENVLVTGPTGTGKSFLVSAIGQQACLLGYKVLYSNASKLFSQLKMAKGDESVLREMQRIEKQDLLIIDDFGLQPFDTQSRTWLMEIMEDRHGKRSTIFTSQLPVKMWYDVIGEQTVADAILDRIVHDAHRIELNGESLRKKTTDTNHLNDKPDLNE